MASKSQTQINKGKKLQGIVVSNKMKDTAVVEVQRFVKHGRYGKYIKRRKKFQAHDPGNTASIGEKVTIIETRPISKNKHFRIITNERSE